MLSLLPSQPPRSQTWTPNKTYGTYQVLIVTSPMIHNVPIDTYHMIHNLPFVTVSPYINDTASSEPNPAVVINNTISIHCSAHGIPRPRIKWLMNGTPLDVSLDERLHLQLEGRTLVIEDAQVPDTGRYTCIATNEAGVADKDFDLDVWGECRYAAVFEFVSPDKSEIRKLKWDVKNEQLDNLPTLSLNISKQT